MKNKFIHIISFLILLSVLSEISEITFSFLNDDEVSEVTLENDQEEEGLEDIYKTKIINNQFFIFKFFKYSNYNNLKTNLVFVLSGYSIETKAIPVPPPELIG